MTKQEAIEKMNRLGADRRPFLFIIDFKIRQPLVFPLDELDNAAIRYSINGKTNSPEPPAVKNAFNFSIDPVSKDRYAIAFNLVQRHITHGDTFLLNLTMPSHIDCSLSLQEIFHLSKARYKLWFDNRFVVFSPETFVKIKGRQIISHPMKGTIEATGEDAEKQLLASEKELAEHYTIVDLIRNDLSMVAKQVKVEKFRQIERIKTHKHELLQMTSRITGQLPADFHGHLGNIFFTLLPAGSISGAPKLKTIEVIQAAEQYDRGYYTGVFGLFDGENLESGVMIRFIENTGEGLIYKSGGGITAMSQLEEEYTELIKKIYIPVKG